MERRTGLRPTVDVAVVVAAKDAAGTIDAALASLAAQSSLPTQVVVVDDGSSDGTGELAAAWSDRLPVMVMRLEASRGPGQARRVGVNSTSAPLLSFLDADDVVLPSHLSDLSATHARHGGIVSPDGLFWFPGRGVEVFRYRDGRPVRAHEHQVGDILRHNFLTIASLVSRADYDRVGGWRGDFDGAEDWDLWMRLVRDGVPVHEAGASYVYRQSAGSYSRESRTAAASLALIQSVLPELAGSERQVAVRTRRTWQGKLATASALAHAREGRWRTARSTALPALKSRDLAALRAAALVISPQAAVRLAAQRADRLWGEPIAAVRR